MRTHQAVLGVALAIFAATATWAEEGAVAITTGNQRDCDPVISPNGDFLAFASDRTGQFDIFVYNYKERSTSQLTQSPKDDRYPNWSADSKKIVFCSERTGSSDLYEMTADGSSGFLQLTDLESLEEYPSFVAKGNQLLFARSVKRGIVRKKMEVVLMDREGGAGTIQVLAEGDEPRLSPDGTRIAFVSRRTKNNDVWLMKMDGTTQTQLSSDEKDDENPAFSPDGKQIVFASKRTGNFDIWVMNVDGGDVRQLTSDPADEKEPCWSVGGYIYYTRKMSETSSNIYRIPAPR